MTFVNEYISEENLKKFNIKDLYVKYNPRLIKKGIPDYKKFSWIADKSRDFFLVRMKNGREELSHHSEWVVFFRGEIISLELARAVGGSKNYSEVPYVKVWDFVSMGENNFVGVEKDLIFDFLKEALTVYGDNGVNSHVENVEVKFNF